MDFMLRHLLGRYPELARKDNQRDFTHQQKLAVFRRDQGTCQVRLKCDGGKVTWGNWHCDHKMPWSKGGTTTVDNAQVACTTCNPSKSNTVAVGL
jgi:5-methylcytosine-specific restriction endonuclease McrA